MGRRKSNPEETLEKNDDLKNYTNINKRLRELPIIDLTEPEEVQRQLELYFSIYEDAGVKPTVAGMAIALGLSRQDLNNLINGRGVSNVDHRFEKLPKSTLDCVRTAYRELENLWEMRFENGKVNPATGIFLGKNHFGYKDVVDTVVTETPKQIEFDADAIRSKYLPTDRTLVIEADVVREDDLKNLVPTLADSHKKGN